MHCSIIHNMYILNERNEDTKYVNICLLRKTTKQKSVSFYCYSASFYYSKPLLLCSIYKCLPLLLSESSAPCFEKDAQNFQNYMQMINNIPLILTFLLGVICHNKMMRQLYKSISYGLLPCGRSDYLLVSHLNQKQKYNHISSP